MLILNTVIDLFPRVWELLCKPLSKHRILVYTSCVGNQLPRALPRVHTLNELSRRLLSETSDLLLKFLLLLAFHFPPVSLSKKKNLFVIDYTSCSRLFLLLCSSLLKPAVSYAFVVLFPISHAHLAIKEKGKYTLYASFSNSANLSCRLLCYILEDTKL